MAVDDFLSLFYAYAYGCTACLKGLWAAQSVLERVTGMDAIAGCRADMRYRADIRGECDRMGGKQIDIEPCAIQGSRRHDKASTVRHLASDYCDRMNIRQGRDRTYR